MSLLGVDIGSSSCKAIVFSEDGCVLAQAAASYPPFHSPHPSWAEMPAEAFWQAFTTVVRSVSTSVPNNPVDVLAISSHAETFVPADASGQAIGPAILNFDNRATAQAKAVAEMFPPRRIFEITGLTPHPMYPVPKMLWLRACRPETFSATARFLAVPAYISAHLGLPASIDYSLASRYLAFDIRSRTWSSEILDECGFSAEQLPPVVPAGTIAGELSAAVAHDLGLNPGTPVAVGGHDQPCGALGCGVFEPGRVSASLGTYECLVAASRSPSLSHGALAANLNSYCHVVPERYVTLAYFPAGIMVEWFLRLLYAQEAISPAELDGICWKLEQRATPGPTGLCITPHLLGTCNPDFNPAASGVIAGIRPGTTRADLYKGILEGLACEFAGMCGLLQDAVGVFTEVYVTGGGAHSPLGLLLRATLSGRKLHSMECPDSVCLGTAMLAGVAIGKYRSFAHAAQQLVRLSHTVAPDPGLAGSYATQAEQYRILYSSLSSWRRAAANAN